MSKKQQVVLFSSAAIALYGYDQGMMSLINTNSDYLGTMKISKESNMVGVIVAIYYLGCAVGSVIASQVGDKYGRKICIYLSLIVTVIGNLVMFFAGFKEMAHARLVMIIGRVVLGLGVGAIDMVIPVFSGELSSDSGRGKALAQEFQFNILGLLIAYGINLVATHQLGSSSEWAWRIPIISMQIFPIILLSTLFTLPETPRFLLSHDREDEAKKALEQVVGKKEAKKTFDELKQAKEDEEGESVSYSDMLLPSGKQFHATMVGPVMGQVNQALTGYGAVSVFGPQIFQLLGFGTVVSEYITLGNFVSYLALMTFAWLLIDRVGRRRLMINGSIVLTVCFALLAVFGYLAVNSDKLNIPNQAASIPGTILLFIATGAFGIGWLACPWLMPTEIFPNSARTQGSAISVIVWGIMNALVTLGTPIGFNNLKYGLFAIFAGTNLIALAWTFIYTPETGGRSFEENQEFFEKAGEEGTWRVRRVAKGKYARFPSNEKGENQPLLS